MTGFNKAAHTLKRHWPLLVIFGVWFVLFFKINTGQEVVGYRDSAYLYYPYFQWIDQQWQKGEIPLWNPYCDLGYPVVADGTSSVFYPGKLIFLARVLDYPTRYGLYLSLHVLWAAISAYLLVLNLRGSPIGAGVAAASYAFGGSVLFQVTNVVYLVSASWLPLGLLCLVGMAKRRKIGRVVSVATVAALMVLGGDPQMAYVLLVISAVGVVIDAVWNRKRYRTWRIYNAKLYFGFRNVLAVAVFATALSAIQVMPTYLWSQQSVRVEERLDVAEKSLEPQQGTHLHAAYEFSLPPWSVSELVWPNISGKPFPVNGRWASGLPGADRIWTPSLFVGFLTLLFAAATCRLSGLQRMRVWWTWIGLFFCVASFGWYGIVWLVRELLPGAGFEVGEAQNLGSQVGGLYWLATVVLPGFDAFRYPAKLFTVASLAISTLAGLGATSALQKRRTLILSMGLVGLSVCLFLLDGLTGYLESGFLIDADLLFGPFAETACRRQVGMALIHTICVGALLAFFWFMVRRKKERLDSTLILVFFVLLVELAVGNFWMLCKLPSSVFTDATRIEAKLRETSSNGTIRLMRMAGMPVNWNHESSQDRFTEIVKWQQETLHAKHHLVFAEETGLELAGSFTSIENKHVRKWRKEIAESFLMYSGLRGPLSGGLAVSYEGDPVFWKYGKLRLVNKFRLANSEANLSELEPLGQFDEETSAIFEVIDRSAGRYSVKVAAEKPVALVCSSLPDAGWKVCVTDVEGKVVSGAKKLAGDFHLAVDVPRGVHQVDFYYSPIEFWVGLWVSVASWLALLIWFFSRSLNGSINGS